MSVEHQNVIPLHDELLRRNEEAVKQLREEVYGIPQRMDSLEKGVSELCKTVAENNKSIMELLQRIEGKYQTKEMCNMCSMALEKEISDLKEANLALREEVTTLEKRANGLAWKLLSMTGIFIIQLIVWIFLNQGKLGVTG